MLISHLSHLGIFPLIVGCGGTAIVAGAALATGVVYGVSQASKPKTTQKDKKS